MLLKWPDYCLKSIADLDLKAKHLSLICELEQIVAIWSVDEADPGYT